MLKKIISGGQTGADQAGLIAGKQANIQTGGTAPKDYLTSTGQNLMLKYYGLKDEGTLRTRTIKNIIDSDGTILLTFNHKSPGSILTENTCVKNNKPVLKIDLNRTTEYYEETVQNIAVEIQEFIKEHDIEVLNVAGNRERNVEGVVTTTCVDIIYEAIKDLYVGRVTT